MSVSITVTNERDRDRSYVNNFSPKGDEAVLFKNPCAHVCVCVWERESVCLCVWVGQWWMRMALVSPPPPPPPPMKFTAAYLSLPSVGQSSHHRIKPQFISVLQNKMVPLKLHKTSFNHWIVSSRVRESWMENLQINVLLDPCCLLCCPEPLWYIISHYHWRPPALTVIFTSDIKVHVVISVHP